MAESGDLKHENAALRRCIATLHAAILGGNASLDLDTVLGEVVERARALTGEPRASASGRRWWNAA